MSVVTNELMKGLIILAGRSPHHPVSVVLKTQPLLLQANLVVLHLSVMTQRENEGRLSASAFSQQEQSLQHLPLDKHLLRGLLTVWGCDHWNRRHKIVN